MSELLQYISEHELVRQHTDQPKVTKAILRGFGEPLKLLPLLLQLPLFIQMHLPRALMLNLIQNLEVHVIPCLERVVELPRTSSPSFAVRSSPTPTSSPISSPMTNHLHMSTCPSKDLAFVVLQNNTIEMVTCTDDNQINELENSDDNQILCTISAGDAIGVIPERQAFTEFGAAYSRVMTGKKSALLLGFPIHLLRNGK